METLVGDGRAGNNRLRRRGRGRVHRTKSTRNRRPMLESVSIAVCRVVEEGKSEKDLLR